MKNLRIGADVQTGQPVFLPIANLVRHLELLGATGTGKTVFLVLLSHFLMLEPACGVIIIDRMGGFSWDLLLWLASRFCPRHMRDRLIYHEVSRENVALPFNPLPYESPAHGFYRVMRAVEVILRGWENQNIEAMPRLSRWIFNAFWAAAQLGLTISDCFHFLMPSSPLHARLIALLPEHVQYEWSEITHGRPADVAKILEAVRNRLKPFFENDILRRMFGGTRNLFDIVRFMAEGKIVLINLAPQNRLSPQVADAIGGLTINELLAGVRSLALGQMLNIYCILDEFQNFVGPDFEFAIPEVRQKGVRLVCAHQSYSQLVRGETDLRGIIAQLQNRLTFGLHGKDADLAAHELAALMFDPDRIKDVIYSTKQRVVGHNVVELESSSESFGRSESSGSTSGMSSSDGRSTQEPVGLGEERLTRNSNSGFTSTTQSGSSESTTRTRGRSQTLIPIYQEYQELSSRTYVSLAEQEALWAKKIRQLPVGHAVVKAADSPMPREVAIRRDAPGFLAFDSQTIQRRFPGAIEDAHRLIEENFARGPFCTPEEIERETTERLERVLGGRIVISTSAVPAAPVIACGNAPFA